MIIYVDIDNTICITNGMDYNNSKPIYDNINKVNKLYEESHFIVLWTARGTLSNNNYFKLTYNQLQNWNVKFHELRMGKPAFDLLIDDKALNSIWDWKNSNVNNILSKKTSKEISIIEKMIIIIQTRSSSTRLPNKIMLPFFNNKTILDIISERLLKNKYNIPICIATTTNNNDTELFYKYQNNNKIFCFRGSENNVLSRFIDCAETFNKEIIIRVCSDNPFISLKYLENLIDFYLENENIDYLTYSLDGILPCIKSHIGIFSEIATLRSLKKTLTETSEQKYLENVTEYIYNNTDQFFIKLIKENFNSNIINDIRLTLDTLDDFKYLIEIYKNLDITDDIHFNKILNYLYKNNEILDKMKASIKKNIKIY